MDGKRFDDLARVFADSSGSRRRLLKGSLAAIGVALGLSERASAAQVKRTSGEICRKHGDCASNVCLPKDKTGRQYCGCVNSADCGLSSTCKSVACQNNRCTTVIAQSGTPCDDGNSCTVDDHCEQGVCVPGSPPSCDQGQVCYQGSCCTPTCGPNDDSCEETVSDGCGGTINCTCGEGLICSNNVCIADDTGSPCEDDTGCLSGNCALDGLSPNITKVCCPAGIGHCGGTCCASATAACYTDGCCESGFVALSSTICCPDGTTSVCSSECCSGTQTCKSDSYDPQTFPQPICCSGIVCSGACCSESAQSCDGTGNCPSENP